MWKDRGTRMAEVILKKGNKMGRITLPNFKTFSFHNQDCVVLAKRQTCRSMERNSPTQILPLIFVKGAKVIQWKNSFNNGAGLEPVEKGKKKKKKRWSSCISVRQKILT